MSNTGGVSKLGIIPLCLMPFLFAYKNRDVVALPRSNWEEFFCSQFLKPSLKEGTKICSSQRNFLFPKEEQKMVTNEFLAFNKNKETDYFTKGAEIYDAVKTGVYKTKLQQDFAKLSEYEQAAVIDSTFFHLHEVVKKETWYVINLYKLNKDKYEDLVSIIDEKMVETFDSYNNNTGTNYCISTFIRIYIFEYIRVLMSEEKDMTEAEVKNLSSVIKAMDVVCRDVGISREQITAKMVKEKINEKCPSHPISEEMVQGLMDRLEGKLSMDEMYNSNDPRLNNQALVTDSVEKTFSVSNLDKPTRAYFAELFRKMNDKDWLILLKSRGMFGDVLKEMEADRFIQTDLYAKVIGRKTGKDAEKKMIKTIYNRNLKVNEIMDSIPPEKQLEYIWEFKEYFEEQAERILSEYFE